MFLIDLAKLARGFQTFHLQYRKMIRKTEMLYEGEAQEKEIKKKKKKIASKLVKVKFVKVE